MSDQSVPAPEEPDTRPVAEVTCASCGTPQTFRYDADFPLPEILWECPCGERGTFEVPQPE